MRQVTLGASAVQSGAVGLGCMGMSEFYGPAQDEALSHRTLARALELGVTLWDTADMYGRGHNEAMIGRFLKGRARDKVVLSSKFGIIRDPQGPQGSLYDRDLDNSRGYMRKAIEGSLTRLGTDHLDLYTIHRMDAARPIEETIADLADLVKEGKIKGIGLSEVSPDILRRAASVHPISTLQSEYSLFHREVEAEILPLCRALGIAFVPYSPLGRGFLTGAITSAASLDKSDLRQNAPRFQGGNIDKNLQLLEQVKTIAAAKGCSLGQVALAWLFAQGDDIAPIPGTKRAKYLEENAAAAAVILSAAEARSISAILAPEHIAGGRDWKAPEARKAAAEIS